MKILVTGGGGFLGRAIINRFIQRGDDVCSYSRGNYPDLEKIGVKTIQGDLANYEATSRACSGCDAVIHTAALVPTVAGSSTDFVAANVTGTDAIIKGCRDNNINKLVFTSSPSVIFSGNDLCGVDETMPYPKKYDSPYSKTKSLAEQNVLAANDISLATVALRPHLVWGPGDTHLVPQIAARSFSGRLRQIGNGPYVIDTTYIDNAADAHIQVLDRLIPGQAPAGKAYFISQGEPIDLWEMVNQLLVISGAPIVTRKIPRWVALAIATAVEILYKSLRIKAAPPITKFLVQEISSSHWFNIDAAKNDFGYQPRISTEEGLKILAQHYKKKV